jgi:hypothetical protein
MEVNFQTLCVWDAIHHSISDDPDEDEYHDDRQAMSGLLRSVPSELWGTLATKDTVKQAWDAVRTLRIGDERARDASAQQLCWDFANLTFKEGESVTDFGVRITALATNLLTLGDNITDSQEAIAGRPKEPEPGRRLHRDVRGPEQDYDRGCDRSPTRV